MQDAIILYENGKAIGGEGHPTYARDITFENEGTDLVSEQTNDAIKEVNEKTKHGIVELWKNSDSTVAFAGQTISINTDKVIDTIFMECGEALSGGANAYRLLSCEVGGRGEDNFTALGASGKVSRFYRSFSVTQSGNILSVTISDCTRGVCNTYGSALAYDTANLQLVPIRILGVIHES